MTRKIRVFGKEFQLENLEDLSIYSRYFLIFFLIKVRKSKELIRQVIFNLILFFAFTYILFNSFITTQALFINQTKSTEKKIVVYEIFNHNNFFFIGRRYNTKIYD